MPRRTEHEMDEWPEIRQPWHRKYWKWVLIWMVVVVVLIALGSLRRMTDLVGARTLECRGVVHDIRTEPSPPGSKLKALVVAKVEVRGKMIDIPVDQTRYPNLRVGDKLDLTCKIGRTGTLFVQQWRPGKR